MTDIVSRVLINCPQTGRPVGAVLRLRPAAFEGLQGAYSFRCTLCGEIHSWTKADAWLEPAAMR
jgi:hypothetical protein